MATVIKRELIHPKQHHAKGIKIQGGFNLKELGAEDKTIEFTLKLLTKASDGFNYAIHNNLTGIYAESELSTWKIKYRSYAGTDEIIDLGVPANNFTHFVLTFSSGKLSVYLNSELKIDNISIQVSSASDLLVGYDLQTSANKGIYDIRLMRTYNYILSSDEVKESYNLGRWDKYKIKSIIQGEMGYFEPTFAEYFISTNGGPTLPVTYYTVENTNGFTGKARGVISQRSDGYLSLYDLQYVPIKKQIGAKYQIKFKYRCNSKISSLAVPGRIYDAHIDDAIEVTENVSVKYASYVRPFNVVLYDATASDIIDGTQMCWVEFQMISIKQLGCTSEYIPSAIGKSEWRNTSGIGNHLTLSGTYEILYEEPYKVLITGTTAPSVLPDFMGQKYYNTLTKDLYMANGLTSISNWKLLFTSTELIDASTDKLYANSSVFIDQTYI